MTSREYPSLKDNYFNKDSHINVSDTLSDNKSLQSGYNLMHYGYNLIEITNRFDTLVTSYT